MLLLVSHPGPGGMSLLWIIDVIYIYIYCYGTYHFAHFAGVAMHVTSLPESLKKVNALLDPYSWVWRDWEG